jgi:hypothetical protein
MAAARQPPQGAILGRSSYRSRRRHFRRKRSAGAKKPERDVSEPESIILDFLRATPDAWYSRREIARRAVRRTEYEENPHWADQALAALLARGIAEANEQGLYRLMRRR